MCILFIYRNPEAGEGNFKFILASNRDEFHARPAKIAGFWDDRPDFIGGIDMEPGKEGGTWLAASKKGKSGVLLNLTREPRDSNISAKGRGSLIVDYLESQEPTMDFLNNLHETNQKQQLYNPYNLVVAELKTANVYCLSSSKDAEEPKLCEEQILGFSNSGLERSYKKVQVGKENFRKIVENTSSLNKKNLVQDLLKFLKNREKHLPDPELVKRNPEHFECLSSIFVDYEIRNYGTRTHTIILVDHSNEFTFIEETMMENGKWNFQSFCSKLS